MNSFNFVRLHCIYVCIEEKVLIVRRLLRVKLPIHYCIIEPFMWHINVFDSSRWIYYCVSLLRILIHY